MKITTNKEQNRVKNPFPIQDLWGVKDHLLRIYDREGNFNGHAIVSWAGQGNRLILIGKESIGWLDPREPNEGWSWEIAPPGESVTITQE